MTATGVRLGYLFAAVLTGLVGIMGSLVATTSNAAPVSQKPQERKLPAEDMARHSVRPRIAPIFALDVGLDGPPLVADDGTWWLAGRDGQLVHMAPNDTLHWAVGLGASVSGGAALGEHGLLFVPTVKNSIVAMEPRGVSRWRSRAPWGIDGPLAWVPTQGLVFVSNDQYAQWLAANASLLQRSKLVARRSAGPAALGSTAAIGTESGALLVWSNLSKRFQLQLEAPVRAIVGESQKGFVVVAGTRAYWVVGATVHWQRAGVVAAGVVATSAPAASNVAVIASQQGEVQWLDAQGNVTGACKAPWSTSLRLIPEIAVGAQCVWVSSSSGELWQCCINGSTRQFPLSSASLTRPIVDWPRGRVLVSSSRGEVWSIPIPEPAAH